MNNRQRKELELNNKQTEGLIYTYKGTYPELNKFELIIGTY